MRRSVRGDERRIDDEDEIELGRLGQPRILDIPADVDARVASQIGVAPA